MSHGRDIILAFEWIVTVDHVAPLKNRGCVLVSHCSFSTLGCGSLGA